MFHSFFGWTFSHPPILAALSAKTGMPASDMMELTKNCNSKQNQKKMKIEIRIFLKHVVFYNQENSR